MKPARVRRGAVAVLDPFIVLRCCRARRTRSGSCSRGAPERYISSSTMRNSFQGNEPSSTTIARHGGEVVGEFPARPRRAPRHRHVGGGDDADVVAAGDQRIRLSQHTLHARRDAGFVEQICDHRARCYRKKRVGRGVQGVARADRESLSPLRERPHLQPAQRPRADAGRRRLGLACAGFSTAVRPTRRSCATSGSSDRDRDLSRRSLLKIVSLETMTTCNQKCYFCPVSIAPREDEAMTEALFDVDRRPVDRVPRHARRGLPAELQRADARPPLRRLLPHVVRRRAAGGGAEQRLRPDAGEGRRADRRRQRCATSASISRRSTASATSTTAARTTSTSSSAISTTSSDKPHRRADAHRRAGRADDVAPRRLRSDPRALRRQPFRGRDGAWRRIAPAGSTSA